MAINLIPEKNNQTSDKSDLSFYIVMAAIMALLVFSILTGKIFLNNYQFSQFKDKERIIERDEEALKEFKDSVNRYKNHPALTVLANQSRFSQLFEVLEKNTPNSVRYTSFSTDNDNNIKINSTMIGTFKDAASFMKVLKKANFQDVNVYSLVKDDNGQVTFNIDFKFTKDMVSIK